ncbi:MAG: cell division protein FtsZ, partial [Pseudomonadota bacterium]
FADVRSVMEEMGKAMMGTGEADGETRAIDAAEKAIANPLLDEVSLKGAKGVLINITGGYDLTLFEMDEAANRIKDEVDANALIKFGSAIDPEMEGKMRVSVVATGIDAEAMERRPETSVPQRRRPAVTDPTGVQAIRGAMQRAEAPKPLDVPAPMEAADPAQPAPSAVPVAEAQPRAVAEAPTDEVERYAATTPTPDEIRQRAERVRQAALAARAEREAARAAQPSFDDDGPSGAGLFDLDDLSIDAQAAPAPSQPANASMMRRPPARPAPEMAAEADQPTQRIEREESAAGQAARAGLFTINRLISRVAGHADTPAAAPRAEPRYDPRRPERADHYDDDEGDVPAFLRRQAN